VQPLEGVILVDVGPSGKDLDEARAKIAAGEDRDRVLNALVGKVLDARVEMHKRKLRDLTERVEKVE